MSFSIGFSGERKEEPQKEQITLEPKEQKARKSVVEVYFCDRDAGYSYYNDKFDLKKGDCVWVEGKLEGLRGYVVSVNYNFKIDLSHYKKVIAVADRNINGEVFLTEDVCFSPCRDVLNFEKISSWYFPPAAENGEIVSGNDGETFDINALDKIKIPFSVKEKGFQYYAEKCVEYMEINEGRVRAVVVGSKPYLVEFEYRNGTVTMPVCDCYCSGWCKHGVAALLYLKNLLDDEKFSENVEKGYFAALSKEELFRYVISPSASGSISFNMP